MKSCKIIDMKIHGKATVGPKWQIVIPKDVRNLIWIKSGDDLVVISKWWMAIGMVKSDDITKVIKYMQSEINT